ncbi:MAG: hypothetical protein ACI4R8_01310 [Candidatus Caccovivens sp.]
MMICRNCEMVFEDDEVPSYEDDFGFETGVGFKSYKQKFIGNCSCGGEIVEAEQCNDCEEWFEVDKLSENNLCKNCKNLKDKEQTDGD